MPSGPRALILAARRVRGHRGAPPLHRLRDRHARVTAAGRARPAGGAGEGARALDSARARADLGLWGRAVLGPCTGPTPGVANATSDDRAVGAPDDRTP